MRRASILLAAALTVGGFTYVPGLFAGQTPAVQQPQNSNHPSADVSAVHTLIGNAADASLRENGWGDLVNNFSNSVVGPGHAPIVGGAPADKAHANPTAAEAGNGGDLTSITAEEHAKLNDQIRVFRDAFKAKYGQDFSIHDPDTLFGDITGDNLIEGQAQPAAAEIPGNAAGTPAAAQPAANDQGVPPSPQSPLLQIPAYENAPAISIRLVRSGSSFQFDCPQQLNQPLLAANLTHCLMKLNDHQGDWPADANTTTRLVSQHVLGAVQKTLDADANTNPTANPAPRQ